MMIEELKVILDLLGDVTGIAGWILGAFILFKATIYLSTAGMIYKLVSMAIEKLHNFLITKKVEIVETEYIDKLNGRLCGDNALPELLALLEEVRMHTNGLGKFESSYIHHSHIDVLKKSFYKHKEDLDK